MVIDEQGNTYEATYPKRAKGLVKNGRARFVNDNTICLVCPPCQLEDIIMKNQDNHTVTTEETAVALSQEINNVLMQNPDADVGELVRNSLLQDDSQKPQPLHHDGNQKPVAVSMEYVLAQIEKIAQDTAYLRETVQKLGEITSTGPGDVVGSEQAEALGKVVQCRETTNQQLLRFYEKMYDDLKQTPSVQEQALRVVERVINNPTCGEDEKSLLPDLLDTIRHL